MITFIEGTNKQGEIKSFEVLNHATGIEYSLLKDVYGHLRLVVSSLAEMSTEYDYGTHYYDDEALLVWQQLENVFLSSLPPNIKGSHLQEYMAGSYKFAQKVLGLFEARKDQEAHRLARLQGICF